MGPEQTQLGFVPAAIALAAVLSANVTTQRGVSRPEPRPSVAAPADSTRLLLNALLVPALDSDAVPLRWVDPRKPALCGPATEVRVDHRPLVAGALLPDAPFELEWQADGCHPFGAAGPRVDGRVRLTVFREDWGLSAIVEPSALRFDEAGHTTTLNQRSAATLPFIGEASGDDAPLLVVGD